MWFLASLLLLLVVVGIPPIAEATEFNTTDDDYTHDFVVDIIQGDNSNGMGDCSEGLATLVGDQVIYHSERFWMENITLVEDVSIVLDESEPGKPVDTSALLGKSAANSEEPSMAPSASPSIHPSVAPTSSPSYAPSISPTAVPSAAPSKAPSGGPTSSPTMSPTRSPTVSPTKSPSQSPTRQPTSSPTGFPTVSPTLSPTRTPTESPTAAPASYCCSDNYRDCKSDEWCNTNEAQCTQCSAAWIVDGGCPADGIVKDQTCTNNINGCCPGLECVGNSEHRQCVLPSEGAAISSDAPTSSRVSMSSSQSSASSQSATSAPITPVPSPVTPAPVPVVAAAPAQRTVVARQNFDGVEQNYITGFAYNVDNWDGFNKFFGVEDIDNWPGGFPWQLADSTTTDMTGFGKISSDKEGIFGQNRNRFDKFFAIVDSDDHPDPVATFEFDVDGYQDLEISIDMGAIARPSHFSPGFPWNTNVKFTVEVDGCQEDAFVLGAVDETSFSTRPMDNGNPSGGGNVLGLSGLNPITKYIAEDGSAASNVYLDKSISWGPNAGEVDTFKTSITCPPGSTLKLTVNAIKFRRAMVFDNIVITGVPDVGSGSRRRRLSETAQTDDEDDLYTRARLLYNAYWFDRYTASGSMSCRYCSGSNRDSDFRRLMGDSPRGLTESGQDTPKRSIHSEYESFMSFHLTRDIRDYLRSTGSQCLGPVNNIEAYFALTS